jgi:hypothetical protein
MQLTLPAASSFLMRCKFFNLSTAVTYLCMCEGDVNWCEHFENEIQTEMNQIVEGILG